MNISIIIASLSRYPIFARSNTKIKIIILNYIDRKDIKYLIMIIIIPITIIFTSIKTDLNIIRRWKCKCGSLINANRKAMRFFSFLVGCFHHNTDDRHIIEKLSDGKIAIGG